MIQMQLSETKSEKDQQIWFEWLKLVGQNQGQLGDYFRGLLEQYYDSDVRPTIGYFVRLKAYQENNIAKLIELAQDYKTANQAMAAFWDKYTPELFTLGVNDWEKQHIELLEKVIGDLTQMMRR